MQLPHIVLIDASVIGDAWMADSEVYLFAFTSTLRRKLEETRSSIMLSDYVNTLKRADPNKAMDDPILYADLAQADHELLGPWSRLATETSSAGILNFLSIISEAASSPESVGLANNTPAAIALHQVAKSLEDDLPQLSKFATTKQSTETVSFNHKTTYERLLKAYDDISNLLGGPH